MTTEPAFRWRSVAFGVFLPSLLFSTGEGAIIPVIPLVARDLGASLAIAGVIASMLMVGELVGDIPSGWIVSRVGERTAMVGASFVAAAGLVLALVARTPLVLGTGIGLVGLATTVFVLARHAFITVFAPLSHRARALSTLGGMQRLGYFFGPFVSAAVIHLTGWTSAAFIVHIVGCVAVAVFLLVTPDPVNRLPGGEERIERVMRAESAGLFGTIWRSRGVLARVGSGAMLVSAVRASRQVILPLWALSIGLNETSTALIIGIAGAVDFTLFYAGGQIMDRFGRMFTVVPSMIGLGLGFLALSLTHELSGRTAWFIALAIVVSLANGIGAGILMTLGADLADRSNPAPFLGAWRFTTDAGAAAAPLLVSGITAVVSLSLAVGVVGGLGLLGAAILARNVPRFTPHGGTRVTT